MIAKLGLDGLNGELALFQLAHRSAGFGDHAARIEPSQVATPGLGARVHRSLRRQLLKRPRILLELADDVFGVGVLLHQDVARLVFVPVIVAVIRSYSAFSMSSVTGLFLM